MKNWKKRWQEELNTLVPEMNEELRNEPIASPDGARSGKGAAKKQEPWYKQIFSTPKRITASAAACGVCVVTLALSLVFGLQSRQGITPPTSAVGAVSVQINPEVVFGMDDKGKVATITAMNVDADVITSNEECVARMQGKPVAEAVKAFVDYAARLGYLDLNTPDAVRISSCVDDETAALISDCLEGYFCEKGAYVVVAEERMTAAAFAEYVGLKNTDTLSALTKGLQNMTAPYYERYAEKNADQPWEKLYHEQIGKEKIEQRFEALLQEHVEKIRQNIFDVQAIVMQEEKIRSHADNPMWGLGDYWTLMAWYQETDYTPSFRTEMQKMQELLSAYEREYGKRIVGVIDLKTTAENGNAQALEMLVSLLSDFNSTRLQECAEYIKPLLQNVNVDVSPLTKLYEIPEDFAGYKSKVHNHVRSQYQELFAQGAENYQKSRTELSGNEYDAYVKGIVDEFGSLENYWASLQE